MRQEKISQLWRADRPGVLDYWDRWCLSDPEKRYAHAHRVLGPAALGVAFYNQHLIHWIINNHSVYTEGNLT